ncbi:DUF4382 domain-containing protein [Moritella sp. F3]|uniref:DUF4382 domain-containing protein n=1 Tax=Moritella sp. F3 TaxID=2718882 RepID=UPI0018E1310C|nr:DUF4382 domain-containing protein [Moritella sp. F3]GIC75388.1 hypothetical protein FMO001_01150 [Moritella sp. F1]GIC80533.1 hypothetical protein FMO003_08140 [Moritella sp. F3]
MKFIKVSVLVLSLLLTACGGDNDDSAYFTVSFSVSDAPVDSADNVVIAFDQLEFIKTDGTRIIVAVDDDSAGHHYQQIDLLDYPGSNSALILTDQVLPVGDYKELIIHIEANKTLSYVNDSNGTNELKQPSNKLKLGSFTVKDETVQSFTIEFDLRKSLVMRGNTGNNNGYILKPHGVTIVDNDTAASLKGTVDSDLFSAGSCINDTGNYVYLYAGHDLDSSKLVDNFDADDDTFNDVPPDIGSFSPYTSTSVDLSTGDYAFGYLPPGKYTVAFSCSAIDDDPVQFDALTIPDPISQFQNVTLLDSQEVIHNFNL